MFRNTILMHDCPLFDCKIYVTLLWWFLLFCDVLNFKIIFWLFLHLNRWSREYAIEICQWYSQVFMASRQFWTSALFFHSNKWIGQKYNQTLKACHFIFLEEIANIIFSCMLSISEASNGQKFVDVASLSPLHPPFWKCPFIIWGIHGNATWCIINANNVIDLVHICVLVKKKLTIG